MSSIGDLVAVLRDDPAAMTRFRRDPELYLDQQGWSGLSEGLVDTALTVHEELHPPRAVWGNQDLLPGVETPTGWDAEPIVLRSVEPIEQQDPGVDASVAVVTDDGPEEPDPLDGGGNVFSDDLTAGAAAEDDGLAELDDGIDEDGW